MSTTWQELRDLAKAIETCTHESPCSSMAHPIVRNCVDHLLLLARLHELNAIPAEADQPQRSLPWG